MSKKLKTIEVHGWHIRSFPIELKRQIKAEAALNGETISQCFYRLLKPLLKPLPKEKEE